MTSVWPHGIITPALDELESKVIEVGTREFESLYELLVSASNNLEQLDYALLLRLERLLYAAEALDIDSVLIKEFLSRRSCVPRVVATHIRLLLMLGRLEEAKSIFCSCPPDFFSKINYKFIQSLICLNEPDEIGWLAAIRETLTLDPWHRDAVQSVAALELKLGIKIGASSYVAVYLKEEPLDNSIRNIYCALLKKDGFVKEAQEEEKIIAFLGSISNPAPSAMEGLKL